MRNIAYSVFLALILTAPVFAQESFQKGGLKIISSVKKDVTTLKVKGEFDKEFTVVYYDNSDIPNDMAKRVLYLKQFVDRFTDIKYGELRFFINSIGGVEVNIPVTSLIYKGTNYAKYLPAGIVMRYDQSYITYEVQAVKDRNNYRVFGIFNREMDMIIRIVGVLEDPRAYAKTQDITYLSAQVVYLTEELRRAEKMMILMSAVKISAAKYEDTLNYINTVIILKERNPTLTYQEIVPLIRKERLPVKRDLILAVFRIYFDDFSSDVKTLGKPRVPNPLSEP